MRALRVVGLSEDGKSVICEDAARSERFVVPADERLRAAARGDVTRLGQIEIELESLMRPREIQARIRAGESVEQVAAAAGVPAHRVERFAYPVLLERSRTAELAQRAHPVREDGPDVQTLAEVAAHAFGLRGQDYSTATWDSWRGEDGRWVVQLRWYTGRSDNRAHWAFHPGAHGGTVTPLDEHAHDLMDPNAANRPLRTVRPVTELARQALEAGGSQAVRDVGYDEYDDEPPVREPVREVVRDWDRESRETAARETAAREAAEREAAERELADREAAERKAAERRAAEREAAAREAAEREAAAQREAAAREAAARETAARETAAREAAAQEAAAREVAEREAAEREAARERELAAQEREAAAREAAVREREAAIRERELAAQQREAREREEREARERAAAARQAEAAPEPEAAPEVAMVKEPEPEPEPVAEQPKPKPGPKPKDPDKPAGGPPVPPRKTEPNTKRGKKNHPIVPSWEDVLLGVRTQRG
ncbi:MAG TPA: septation protein SepH [Pseudonocardiaceae bacterium]|nr:septation protein SepH [Pseudonocardiaceae bacterium]